jgi:predicted GIY-YIG superfamily endonuclease
LISGFTKRYGIKQLVYFEQYATTGSAIQREKTMKHWPRDWKIRTIEKMNPTWADLTTRFAANPYWMAGSSPAMTIWADNDGPH